MPNPFSTFSDSNQFSGGTNLTYANQWQTNGIRKQSEL